MSMNMRYDDSDKLSVYLGEISRLCEKAGLDAQKEGANVVKREVVRRLKSIRTSDEKARARITHMCDDVEIVTKKDEFGDVVVKVQGGKSTGTLWHIVNDGTHRSSPTHFMDLALNSIETDLEKIVDEKLRGLFDD
nr:MAG TPA: type I neck protein [Caudoviricetes sp.]